MLKLWLLSIRLKFPNKLLLGLIIFLIFFGFGFLTLSDYGISWDSAIHFVRGQAYLHYFLTGQADYRLLKEQGARMSYYQADTPSTTFFLERDSGHPPLNDILSAGFNYLFYQKLGLVTDVESYHLFIIFISAILVVVVFLFASQEYSLFAGLIALLSLVLYPLFFAESHFNLKDPVEAAFFTLTIFAFFRGVKFHSWRWLLIASIFSGLALGTKFNILFLPFILLPWLLFRFPRLSRGMTLVLLFSPLVALAILFISWPYLWQDPLVNILNILGYYRKIGSNSVAAGFNLYPLRTIFYTTPLVILFFFLAGIMSTFFLFKKEKQKTSFLFLFWFLVPVIRVSLPGASIYGGTRQIMEFLPAMALLSGLGAEMIRQKVGKKAIVLFLCFLPIAIRLAQVHPNENVYFNPLIGGLAGAKEKSYPYWGLSLGNPYKQGIDWLNKNAEPNARVALVIGTGANIYRPYFRPDIKYDNQFWSGYKRGGEYLMEVIHQDWIRVYYFGGDYVDRLLAPVYEVRVDGVSILKIWKNDAAHTYPRFLKEETVEVNSKDYQLLGNALIIQLEKEGELLRIMIDYDKENSCSFLKPVSFSTSVDGKEWQTLKEPLKEYMIEGRRLIYPMAAERAKYIRIKTDDKINCIAGIKRIKISRLIK